MNTSCISISCKLNKTYYSGLYCYFIIDEPTSILNTVHVYRAFKLAKMLHLRPTRSPEWLNFEIGLQIPALNNRHKSQRNLS